MTLFKANQSGPGPNGVDIWLAGCHFETDLGIGDALSAWKTAVTTLWTGTNALQDIISTEINASAVKVVSINEQTGKQIARADDDISLGGADEGQSAPPQTCLLASFQTGLATRAGRGRMYLPPPSTSESILTNGILTANAADTLGAALDAWFSAMSGASLDLVIYHRPVGGTGGGTTPVTSVRGANVTATQRRRRNKFTVQYS